MNTPLRLLPAALLLAACANDPVAADAPARSHTPDASATPEQLTDRIAAAKQIRVLPRRDGAWHAIALDAAASGHAETCGKALASFYDLGDRDRTAESCAVLLADRDQLADANRIAMTIRNLERRDQVLARIAAGPGGDR